MREGLALLVCLHPDMQLVGAAATAEGAAHMYLDEPPDVTLMDLDLPERAGIGAIRNICDGIAGLASLHWRPMARMPDGRKRWTPEPAGVSPKTG